MARHAICIKCNLDFPSEASYELHVKSGHTKQGIGVLITSPNVAPEALPTPEFMEALNRIEAKQEEAKVTPPVIPVEVVSDPIKLTYLFKGNCPTDKTVVETIELEADDKYYVIARCPTCKVQLETKKVVKL